MAKRPNESLLERMLPEHRLYVKSGHDNSTRYLKITPRMQAGALLLGTVIIGWSLVATTALILGQVTADSEAAQARAIKASQDARIEELAAERDQRAREAATMRERFALALEELSRYQRQLLEVERSRREYATSVDLMRTKLQTAVARRDIAAGRARDLAEELTQITQSLEISDGSREELFDTMAALTDALSGTVETRDAHATRLGELEAHLAGLEFQISVEADRKERIFTQLEDAVAVTLEPLEKLLSTTGRDVDTLIAQVQSQYSGQGGPFVPTNLSVASAQDDPTQTRYLALMAQLDRAHTMQVAASQLPFAFPVNGTVRYTSSFGPRRDPINGRSRHHGGQDLAGRPGTPIIAAGDGVVTFAGRQSGYGNVIKIRHEFGYETLYAHLRTIGVKKGQTVSGGDVIGGMGNTGRSTGTHLHYEIRIGGKAVNPMPYMKAARDVF